MLKNNKKGFTLIEIIVVVVILAVLMAVAVPSLLKYLDTAQEAPALTETHAIVTAAQKRVIEKYSQTKDENIFLNTTDNKWIEDFVNEGGKIQGSVTVTNKEITRLLYKASNGLYVLYENQEYKIVSEDELKNNIYSQLDQMVVDYTKLTKDLFNSGNVGKFAGREKIIEELVNQSGLVKVDESLTKKAGVTGDLYWKPYYLNNTEEPSMAMFANNNQTGTGGWRANLVYVDGHIYKCNSVQINDFHNYTTTDKLLNYLETNSDKFQKIE